jgi:hypothetical protein
MIEILENATIVYIDGVKERFDAVRLTDKMAITGRIFVRQGVEEFVENGLISRSNIKKIYNGSKKRVRSISSIC